VEESGTVIFHSAHPLVPVRYKDGPLRAVSWGGMTFEPDERGVIMVPVEAVRELTESHGMEGVPEHVAALIRETVRETVQRAVTEVLADVVQLPETAKKGRRQTDSTQTTDGGAVRAAVFPAGGDHPDGGVQPALTETPNEDAVKASQSAARQE
jgi:hypothetical protein